MKIIFNIISFSFIFVADIIEANSLLFFLLFCLFLSFLFPLRAYNNLFFDLMEIRISPKLSNLPTINTKDLHDLQGNLKDLSETNFNKLEESLTEHGFIVPLFVWFHRNKPYTLDGNQRLRYFNTRFPDGVDLPYQEVEAKDKNDAKKKILLISSNYGQITKEGFNEFTASFNDAPADFEEFICEQTTFSEFLDAPETNGDQDTAPPSPDVPFSKVIDEESNYLVLKFDNKQDWLYAQTVLDGFIMPAASTRTNGKAWSKGTGRVLDGIEILKHLIGN